MTRILLFLSLVACDGTSADAPEPAPAPAPAPAPVAEPAPAPAPAPAPTPAPVAVSSGLCPPDLGDLTGWRPPSPYEATEPVCARFQARKSGECMEAVMREIERLPPTESASIVPSPLHLDAQCQCVPERKAAVSGCTDAPDCEIFAKCAVTLTRDGWAPR